VGTRAGKKVVALLTDMESPLGVAVGNAVETREAFDVLAGGGPPDLVECTMRLASEMLVMGGVARGEEDARVRLAAAIGTGAAAQAAERMIRAQGGDPRVVADRSRLEVAAEEVVVAAPMGAGRTRVDQAVDHAVGIYVDARPGARVARGEPLARLRVRKRSDAEDVRDRVASSFALGEAPPPQRPLVLGRIAGV
jgi:thymidine phosphorylase